MYCRLTHFVKKNHLHWLFTPANDSDQFNETLERMPQYSSSEVNYGYARDSDTVQCRLQIMMCLWQLRCERGQPLMPADALIPHFVSSWNISKGPIDDMSHVLSTCLLPSGAIPGICWLWVRVFSTSLYNGWRLHAMNQSKSTVLSDDCDNRTKVSNARQYHGRTFREFLMALYAEMKPPKMLVEGAAAGHTEAVGSPAKRPTPAKRVGFKDWANNPEWIKFRKEGHGHVPTKILDLMGFGLIGTRRKKRKEEQKNPDVKKWCLFCSAIEVDKDSNRMEFRGSGRFVDLKPRKSFFMCSQCLVPLCHGKRNCFAKWHTEDFPMDGEDDGDEEYNNNEEGKEDEDEENEAEIDDGELVFGESDCEAVENIEAV